MAVGLTVKQKRFICHFLQSRNIRDASAACGIPPEKAYTEGLKILNDPRAAEFAAEYSVTMKRFGADFGGIAEEALGRIIGGRINDAVILAKTPPEELTEETINRLDLYNVSELKFGKDGVCEIKFADRLKAVEKLCEIRNGRMTDDAAQSFFDAIGKSAEEE